MGRRMETDDRIVVMGEDVHRLNGGTNGATRGLKDAFPDRILGTPISENAFAGLGGGIALDGRFRPVVEFMYADFMWVAADQLFNQIAKARHMFGGDGAVPFVLRSKVAMGTGYGSQHSMDPAGIFATAPGWRIVAPSTPFDYVGLMNSALRCKDPVRRARARRPLQLHRRRARSTTSTTACRSARRPSAARARSVTVLTYLAMTAYVLQAVEQVGDVDAEVIDLRWLDRASIDWDTIGASIRKTNNVLIAEQGARRHVVRRLAGRRDPAPVLRLARPPVAAGHRRRGVAEHQQGAGAGRDRPDATRSSPALRRDRRGAEHGPSCCGCPRSPPNTTRGGPAELAGRARTRAFAAGDVIATVETDKAVVDVEAEADGVILRMLVGRGRRGRGRRADRAARRDPARPWTTSTRCWPASAATRRRADPQRCAAPRRSRAGRGAAPVAARTRRRGPAGSSPARWPAGWPGGRPAVTDLTGTGPGGRIVRRDVEAALAQRSRRGGRRPRRQPGPAGTRRPHRVPRRAATPAPPRLTQGRGVHRPAAQPDAPGDRGPAHREQARPPRTSTSAASPGSTRCSRCGPSSTTAPRSGSRSTTWWSRPWPGPTAVPEMNVIWTGGRRPLVHAGSTWPSPSPPTTGWSRRCCARSSDGRSPTSPGPRRTSPSARARDGCSSTSSRAARSRSPTSACTASRSSPRSSTRRRPRSSRSAPRSRRPS